MSNPEKELSIEDARTLWRALDRALMETSKEYRLLKRLKELSDDRVVLWNKIGPMQMWHKDVAQECIKDEFRSIPYDYSDMGIVTRNPDAQIDETKVD